MTYEARGPQEFKRASIGTYFDADGVLRVAAVDQPRFDHDPVTGQLLGLLVEGDRTNLLTGSASLGGAGWLITRATAVQNAIVAPNGLMEGAQFSETAVAGSSYIYKSAFTFTAGNTYTLSVYAKKGNGNRLRLSLNATNGLDGANPYSDFDLETGTKFFGTGTITDVGNGWFRCTHTNQCTATTTANWIAISLGIDTQDPASGFYIWGAQLEEGTEASSYIPTTTAPVTRAADLPIFYPATTLLPANASRQERALGLSTARIGSVPLPIRDLWNPDTCPADLLPWLAWGLGCDEWSPDWSDEAKRQTIRESVLLQQRKGSVWSVRRALSNSGYGTAQIVEGIFGAAYDGTLLHDGFNTYGSPEDWAKYRVILDRPISNPQAAQVRRILEYTAPARCHLVALIFTEVAQLYNAAINYDGTYNHGIA